MKKFVKFLPKEVMNLCTLRIKISLDWDNIDQSARLIDSYFFYPFYKNLNAISKEYRFIQLSAPFVGTIDGIASLAQATAGIGEATIKGVRNLLHGTLSYNTESLLRGSLQII